MDRPDLADAPMSLFDVAPACLASSTLVSRDICSCLVRPVLLCDYLRHSQLLALLLPLTGIYRPVRVAALHVLPCH